MYINRQLRNREKEERQEAYSRVKGYANGGVVDDKFGMFEGSRNSFASNAQATASGFYGQWDSITNHIQSFKTLEALQGWANNNQSQLFGAAGAGSTLSSSLNRHAREEYQKKQAELMKETTNNNNYNITVNSQAQNADQLAKQLIPALKKYQSRNVRA
jgi:hypothetical protein